ncbi:MobA/MobL family protein [Staphylococcus aureus]|uniref:MobA/MobL family protein n=1 Tax=Staphylococcus aureus TaxID=1280 RepID=UPI00201A693F|nr:MobA/MobL family protein [Staphylococcus aureus]MCL4579440.1 oriT nickase [Staphylococcus aureus]
MAMYHFQNKIVSKGNGQSATAKSAYNSASKIKDYKENEYKDYSNKQCDYSEILLPKNAGEEYKDREFLWNKVHDVEKRKDSQVAREIIIGLPNEFDPNKNKDLAREFAKSLSEEGMIVDLNIHKINDENPHAHLLCTLRGIDENNEFEPKRKGNKFVRDWNTDEKHNEWRKRWENVQNKHLQMNGFSVRVSADSYKNQNIDLEPTKKEGWKARKFEDETGKKSSISKHNESIKKRNQQKINKMFDEVDDMKSHKLNAFSYMDKSDSTTLKDMAKDLKIYVTPINIYEENERLYDLKQKTALITDDEDRLNKIENIEDRQRKLESINEVFEKQARIFFVKNYPEQALNFSDDEKVFVTRTILNDREDLPSDHELEDIVKEKRIKEAQISLNTVIGNRDISIESIEKESRFFADKLSNILNKNNLSFDDVLENKHEGLEDSLKINYYTNKLDVLRNAENTLEDYYDVQIRELFTDDQDYKAFNEVADIKEKQQLIDFKTYHGSDNTLKMLETGNFIPKYSEEDRKYITEQIKLLQEIEFKPNKNQNDKFVFGAIQKKLLNEYDYDYSDSNDLKHLYQESNEVGDKASIENIEEFYEGSEILVDKEIYNNNRKQHAYSLVNAGLDSMIFNFNEIFRERMPKYINKQYKGKNHSKKRHEVSNKRGIHL